MGELPSGTVTFLFTDVEGSTRLLKHLREHYGKVLAEHQGLLRDAVAGSGGQVIDSQGDSFFCVFRRAEQAATAAAEAQRALAAHEWPEGSLLRVRMGIHTGQAELEDGRYLGVSVHRAARIGAAAHGGQVLLSQTTHDVLRDEEAELPGVSLRDLRLQRLKDLDQPVRLYQLEIEGLPSKFPPLRTEGHVKERSHRPAVLIGALAGVLAAAVAIPIFALSQGGSGGARLDEVRANAVGVIDADGKIMREVKVGEAPTGVAGGEGAVWVTNTEADTVSRIDPQTGNPQKIAVGKSPNGIAVGYHAVWVANSYAGTVSRIDPSTNRVVDIAVGSAPADVAVGYGSVWVTNTNDGTVSRIDPNSDEVVRDFPAGGNPSGIALYKGSIWVASSSTGTVARIDPRTYKLIQRIQVGSSPSSLASGFGSLWVANSLGNTLSRIDPDTNSEAVKVPVGEGPTGVAVTHEGIWVTNEFDGTAILIDPSSGARIDTVNVGNRPEGIAEAAGSLFVAVRGSLTSHRGGVLRLQSAGDRSEQFNGQFDPATYGNDLVNITMYDGLTAFKKVGGVEGTQLVPDLATALPTPTDGGKTYTFQLRRGIRYSTGALVQPQDLRRALERVFVLKTAASFYTGIVGATTCLRKPKACDLSRGIVTDAGTRTVTFHLAAPDPDFLAKLALPPASAVPAATPRRLLTGPGPPGTGPYVIKHIFWDELRFVRNKYFRQWSTAAQPQGFPDEIAWKLNLTPAEMVKALRHHRSDGVLSQAPSEQVPALERAYASQVHVDPAMYTFAMVLNTRVPPFDDVRVRRALNYAVDRKRVLALPGFSFTVGLACQSLPPNMPGYRPYCPYTIAPTSTGVWTAPDLAKATRLVAASRTKGMKVTVLACGPPCLSETVPVSRYFVSLLKRLGYRARLKVVPPEFALATVSNSRKRFQAIYSGWFADYPTASNLVKSSLSCSSFAPASTNNRNFAEFCDPTVDLETARALELEASDPAAATDLWARIYRRLTDLAPWVPLGNRLSVDIVTKRVGNYQYHPFWRMLIDQVWVQ